MKLDTEYNSLMLSMVELSALGQQAGIAPNTLSLVPIIKSDDREAILAQYNRLDKAAQKTFSNTISVLAAPDQVVRLNYSIADSSLTRMFLARQIGNKDSLAALVLAGDNLAVNTQQPARIASMLSSVLAVNAPLFSTNIGITLSTVATIVFIAVMEHYRYASYHSLLTHTTPMESFIISEVMERMEDAASEDFRWPLLLLDKVFPVRIASGFTTTDVAAALDELCNMGLLSKNVAEYGKPELNLYSLKEIGETIRDSMLHDISKVALSISVDRGDGKIGHEAMLLVRDSNYLWFFGMAGSEGIVASIDSVQFGELLKKVLAPPENKVPVAVTEKPKAKATECCAYHPDREPVAACVSCGKLICDECKSTLGGKMYCNSCADAIFIPKNKKI